MRDLLAYMHPPCRPGAPCGVGRFYNLQSLTEVAAAMAGEGRQNPATFPANSSALPGKEAEMRPQKECIRDAAQSTLGETAAQKRDCLGSGHWPIDCIPRAQDPPTRCTMRS